MEIFIPDYVKYILEKLEAAGYEAYIVGGCVRDALLGIEPKDYDVTTSALTSEMMQVFSNDRVIETGILHGTITVLSQGNPIEITTFRIDGDYDDHRHPNNVIFTRSLKEDLSRRDFTINAMAYSESKGLIDLFGGKDDLNAKVIRTVGDANLRFTEDALRILRGLRFASRFNFSIDDDTYKAMLSKKCELNQISVERIYKELCGIICGDSDGIIKTLSRCKNIIFQILPELRAEDGCEQMTQFHMYDVWNHTIRTVAACENELVLRLTMLFHDIAKPVVRKTYAPDRTSFKLHEFHGAIMAENVLKRLKAPNKICERVARYIRFHEYFKNENMTSYDIGKFLQEFDSIEDAEQIIKVFVADQMGKTEVALVKNMPTIDKMAKEIYNYKISGKCYLLKDLKLSGDDLIANGVPKGRIIGEILNELLDKVLRDEIENEKNALLLCAMNLNWKG